MAFLGKFFPLKADPPQAEKSKTEKKAEKNKVVADVIKEPKKDSEIQTAASVKNFIPGILLAPRVTEKTAKGRETGKYVFMIARDKNKTEAKKSVEKIYGVKVRSVKILNMPGKEKRLGRIIGRVPGFKKAIVTLEKGQSIEMQ